MKTTKKQTKQVTNRIKTARPKRAGVRVQRMAIPLTGDMRNEAAKARDRWLESADGKRASNPATLSPLETCRQYLENRLRAAFIAGMEAERALRKRKRYSEFKLSDREARHDACAAGSAGSRQHDVRSGSLQRMVRLLLLALDECFVRQGVHISASVNDNGDGDITMRGIGRILLRVNGTVEEPQLNAVFRPCHSSLLLGEKVCRKHGFIPVPFLESDGLPPVLVSILAEKTQNTVHEL